MVRQTEDRTGERLVGWMDGWNGMTLALPQQCKESVGMRANLSQHIICILSYIVCNIFEGEEVEEVSSKEGPPQTSSAPMARHSTIQCVQSSDWNPFLFRQRHCSSHSSQRKAQPLICLALNVILM